MHFVFCLKLFTIGGVQTMLYRTESSKSHFTFLLFSIYPLFLFLLKSLEINFYCQSIKNEPSKEKIHDQQHDQQSLINSR